MEAKVSGQPKVDFLDRKEGASPKGTESAPSHHLTMVAMPLLQKEPDIFPDNLLDGEVESSFDGQWESDDGVGDRQWLAMYTLSRREKQLMRQLRELRIPFYSPMIPKRYRSPSGRMRESFLPLFSNYVFLFGNAGERNRAVATGTVSRTLEVPTGNDFAAQMRQIKQLIDLRHPLTPESQLEEGDPIRVKSGALRGFEGYVIRRQQKTRLLVWIHLLNQGVSAELDEAMLESHV